MILRLYELCLIYKLILTTSLLIEHTKWSSFCLFLDLGQNITESLTKMLPEFTYTLVKLWYKFGTDPFNFSVLWGGQVRSIKNYLMRPGNALFDELFQNLFIFWYTYMSRVKGFCPTLKIVRVKEPLRMLILLYLISPLIWSNKTKKMETSVFNKHNCLHFFSRAMNRLQNNKFDETCFDARSAKLDCMLHWPYSGVNILSL